MVRRLIRSFSLPLLATTPLRAIVEAFGLGLGLLAVVWIMHDRITPGDQQNGLFIAFLSAMSWYGIRLRNSKPPWKRRILFEGGIGLVVAFGIGNVIWLSGISLLPELAERIDEPGLIAVTGVMLRAFVVVVIKGEPLPLQSDPRYWPAITTILFSSGAIAFITMRGGLYIWRFWSRLRRQYLLWSLTHSHMMLMILALFLYATVATINSAVLISEQETHPDVASLIFSLVVGLIVPLLIIIGLLTVILLILVLLPSLALSYFAARRTTRRLKSLTEATTNLRLGNYHTQVVVQGEDEVATLQTNFNIMAQDLQSAMRDVQAERDNVAKLLRNRRELVASVSHELRTPVAVLRGYVESMHNRWHDQLPDDLLHDITIMENETLRLQRLLDDLFDLSRAEVGELSIHRQPIDLRQVIQQIAATAAPTMWQTYKIELVVELPPALPLVMGDAMRLEQILHNLLRNAMRHTPPGGIVAIQAAANEEQIVLQVKDTGEGIAPEHLPHIWDRFYRADTHTPNSDQAGSGLGLALVKDLTEAMGGKVSVDSTPGLGSTFSIVLPRA